MIAFQKKINWNDQIELKQRCTIFYKHIAYKFLFNILRPKQLPIFEISKYPAHSRNLSPVLSQFRL